MCFYTQISSDAQSLENRFDAKMETKEKFIKGDFNGFNHPEMPVITSENSTSIQFYQWGLIPFWSKDSNIQNSTLNAKIETIHTKPSFRNYLTNRCLIITDGFYEWQWLDEKGKKKQKYRITMINNESFAFAGLWSKWQHPKLQQYVYTFTILTTEADSLMAEIHNTKKRMPCILTQNQCKSWLNEGDLDFFKYQNLPLQAQKI